MDKTAALALIRQEIEAARQSLERAHKLTNDNGMSYQVFAVRLDDARYEAYNALGYIDAYSVDLNHAGQQEE